MLISDLPLRITYNYYTLFNVKKQGVLKELRTYAVHQNVAIPTKRNAYGEKYVIDFEMNHSGQMAIVRSAWIVRDNENFPRLVTCYVLE